MCNCKVQGNLWILPLGTFWASVGKRVTDSPGPSSQLCLLHHIRVKLQEGTSKLGSQTSPGSRHSRLHLTPRIRHTLTLPAPWPRQLLFLCSLCWNVLASSYRTVPSCPLFWEAFPQAPLLQLTFACSVSLQPLGPVALGWGPLYTLRLRFTTLLSS